jgi:octaprenyl-diphosphate synthase
MVELERMRVMQVLADTTNAIAEGEVLQLMHLNNPDVDEIAYRRVIERKTAVLFAAAARVGAILAGAPPAHEEALARCGLELGFAFQIADDLLDYVSDADTLGKNIGDDLAEGKATLPLIRALQTATAADAARLRATIQSGNVDELAFVIETIRRSDALDYCRHAAGQHAAHAIAALEPLPDTPYRAALQVLARYAIARDR